MTTYHGIIELSFSMDAENPEDARTDMLAKILSIEKEQLIGYITLRNFDQKSSEYLKYYFRNPDEDDEE